MPHERASNRKVERPSLLALSSISPYVQHHMFTCVLERCCSVIRALFIVALCPRYYHSRWLSLRGNVPGFYLFVHHGWHVSLPGTCACRRRGHMSSISARTSAKIKRRARRCRRFVGVVRPFINTCPPLFSAHGPDVYILACF